MPGRVLGANLAEIGLLRTAPRIGIGQAKRCSLTFVDLFTAAIAYKNGFSSHEILLLNLLNSFIVAKYGS
ncbi:MAG: hypothetical protein ACYDHO_01175 [Gaiellaceae bacterium]